MAVTVLSLRSLADKDEAGNPTNLRLRSESDKSNIVNNETTYNFGTVAENATLTTGLDYFTVTNNAGFAIDISISGTDMTGGTTWTLSDTATPDVNTYGLKAGLSGGDYSIIVKKTAPFNYLKENLADAGTQDWGLKFYAPTGITDPVGKSGVVTLTATAA